MFKYDLVASHSLKTIYIIFAPVQISLLFHCINLVFFNTFA